jgi:hypothetical protein
MVLGALPFFLTLLSLLFMFTFLFWVIGFAAIGVGLLIENLKDRRRQKASCGRRLMKTP